MLRVKPGTKHRVTVTVNGRPYSGFAEPRTLLSDFLRHELKLFGTHVAVLAADMGSEQLQLVTQAV